MKLSLTKISQILAAMIDKPLAWIVRLCAFTGFLIRLDRNTGHPKAQHSNKNILFVCEGAPYHYQASKENDETAKKIWEKGFRSQLSHPGFEKTYALFEGEKNECYKLASDIIAIVIRKITIPLFPGLSECINIFRIITLGNKLSRKKNISHVETFNPGKFTALYIKSTTGLPVVIQCQGDYDLSSFRESEQKESWLSFLKRQRQKFLFSITFRYADLVLGYNDHCASFAICNGAAPAKVRRCRIHSFIEDFEAYPIVPRTEIPKFPSQGKIVLLWCRLAEEKKLYHTLEAMKIALSNHPGLTLVIAGDGPLKNKIERQMEPYQDNVVFLGNLDRPTLKSCINHADIALVPLAGHSMIEAAMCEKPVVCYNWEWHTEMITHGQSGILIDYPNNNDMSEAIGYLLSNPEIASSMGRKLKTRALTLFKEQNVAAREYKIWQEFETEKRGVE